MDLLSNSHPETPLRQLVGHSNLLNCRASIWKTKLSGFESNVLRTDAWAYGRIVCLLLALMPACLCAQDRALSLPLESDWKMGGSFKGSAAVPATKTVGEGDAAVAGDAAQPRVLPDAADRNIALDRLPVGVGDQIFVTVFGQPDMSAEVSVNDNEQITLSLIGTLKVGGLTPAALEKLIAQRLKDGEYLRNPQVSVQIRQIRSQMISVLGEVARPGRFPILGKLTVLEALALAGGLGARADRTVSLLRRQGGGGNERQEIPVRLDQLSEPFRGELDVELKNDDVVYVAPQKMFYVHGEVRRPGVYPMEPDLNIMRVLSISGGVTERGSLKRIRIHRKTGDQQMQEITPNLNSAIMSGDVIYVDERLF